jgi:hypothetical protein
VTFGEPRQSGPDRPIDIQQQRGEPDARDAADGGKYEALGDEQPRESLPRGAERRAHAELACPLRHAHQYEVRDVDERDREQHECRTECDPERVAGAADDGVLERVRDEPGRRVREIRPFREELAADAAEVVSRLFERDADLESRDRAERERPAPLGRGELHRGPQIGAHGGKRLRAVGHDTDDGVRISVQRERCAKRIGAGAELALGKHLAHHHDACRARPVFARLKAASASRCDPHDAEVVRGHPASVDPRRLAGVRHNDVHGARGGDRLEAPIELRDALEVCDGRVPLARAVVLADEHEPIGLRIRQRTQQHAVDQREHRGRGADAERERERREQREGRRSDQRARGLAEIVERRVHRISLSIQTDAFVVVPGGSVGEDHLVAGGQPCTISTAFTEARPSCTGTRTASRPSLTSLKRLAVVFGWP